MSLEKTENGEQVRLMARVARLHYEQGIKQKAIAEKLNLSASKVSRLLRKANETGIVRTVVQLPDGVHADIEEKIEAKYGLDEVVIADIRGTHKEVLKALSSAGAEYLKTTLNSSMVMGISAWSETLMAVANRLAENDGICLKDVVQLDGGAGHADAQLRAARMLDKLARVSNAKPIVLPVPGVAPTVRAYETYIHDPGVVAVSSVWNSVDVALVGIGSLSPSPVLRQSGNYASQDVINQLISFGAVGDVCLRFFDRDGRAVETEFDSRVIGVTLNRLKKVRRRIAIAGGSEKIGAIQAALRGSIVNTIVTDLGVAESLLGLRA